MWIAAVGLAWLAGSLFRSALSLHQAVLAVVLLAAPTGVVRGRLRLTLALLGSVLIAGEVLPQPVVAGYFLVGGSCCLGVCLNAARPAPCSPVVQALCVGVGAGLRLVGRAARDVGLDRAGRLRGDTGPDGPGLRCRHLGSMPGDGRSLADRVLDG